MESRHKTEKGVGGRVGLPELQTYKIGQKALCIITNYSFLCVIEIWKQKRKERGIDKEYTSHNLWGKVIHRAKFVPINIYGRRKKIENK